MGSDVKCANESFYGRYVAWEKVYRKVFSQSCRVYLVMPCLVLVTWDNRGSRPFYCRNAEPGLCEKQGLESCFWNLGAELALWHADPLLVILTLSLSLLLVLRTLILRVSFVYVFKKGSSLCLRVLHHALGRKEELLCLG